MKTLNWRYDAQSKIWRVTGNRKNREWRCYHSYLSQGDVYGKLREIEQWLNR